MYRLIQLFQDEVDQSLIIEVIEVLVLILLAFYVLFYSIAVKKWVHP